MSMDNHIVIMAGGIGSRFWPMSTPECPKQFIDIMGCGRTLIQLTADRFDGVCPRENVWVVTSEKYIDIVREQLPEIPESNILAEPCARNTAPCIAYACWKIKKKHPNANVVVTPSDALVIDTGEFRRVVEKALRFTDNSSAIVTLGIKPTRPETGYGYIQIKKNKFSEFISKVKTFTEKPNKELAKVFLESGDFLWNAGIFIWNVDDIIEEFKTYLEDIYLLFEQEYKNVENPDSPENIAHIYGQCRNISIDYGIMEKSAKVYVMKGEFGWSDVGTWHSFHEISPKDENNNVSNSEQVRLIETKECIINVPKDKKVIIEGIENCIIAENNDILMICHRDHEDNIRHFDDILKHTTKEL